MDNNQMPPVQPDSEQPIQPSVQPAEFAQPTVHSADFAQTAQPVGQPTPVAGSTMPLVQQTLEQQPVVAQTAQPLGQSAAVAQNTVQPLSSSAKTLQTTTVPTGAQMAAAAAAAAQPKKSHAVLILGIILGMFVVLSGVFIGLFIWKNGEYGDLNDDFDLKIAEAVSNAKTEQALEDAEEAKKDTRQFTGPTDYGQMSFDYPKSWSVYIEADASKGGNFVAYLNPIEIEPVSNTTVYALRVNIRDEAFEKVAEEYQKNLEKSKGALSMETVTVGQDKVTANRYTGVIPGTELNGIIVIFKIRDKTAILRTDSMSLEKDFQTILDSVKFNA